MPPDLQTDGYRIIPDVPDKPLLAAPRFLLKGSPRPGINTYSPLPPDRP